MTFDSLDHSFLLTILEKFSFGTKFIEWIKIFLNDQESFVINGGVTQGVQWCWKCWKSWKTVLFWKLRWRSWKKYYFFTCHCWKAGHLLFVNIICINQNRTIIVFFSIVITTFYPLPTKVFTLGVFKLWLFLLLFWRVVFLWLYS